MPSLGIVILDDVESVVTYPSSFRGDYYCRTDASNAVVQSGRKYRTAGGSTKSLLEGRISVRIGGSHPVLFV